MPYGPTFVVQNLTGYNIDAHPIKISRVQKLTVGNGPLSEIEVNRLNIRAQGEGQLRGLTSYV